MNGSHLMSVQTNFRLQDVAQDAMQRIRQYASIGTWKLKSAIGTWKLMSAIGTWKLMSAIHFV